MGFAPLLSASDCIPIHEASQRVGETKCVAGKVLKIRIGEKGVHFLDFCEDQLACPFTVVVFPSGLKDVGDVLRLAGRTIEIHGAGQSQSQKFHHSHLWKRCGRRGTARVTEL